MIAVAVAAAGMLASEVLALVHGRPVTRADLQAALQERDRQEYVDALADLRDFQHAAVRDYLGRQAVKDQAARQSQPEDSIYTRTLAADYAHFDPNLRSRIQRQREKVYSIEKPALDALIEKRLFEEVAQARGMSPEKLTATLSQQVAPVTADDLEFIKAYEESKEEVSATVEPGEPRLEAAIRAARVERLRMAMIDSVRARDVIGAQLPPPRVEVTTTGASVVGTPSAPIRIVVFTDFECPYCLESERTLARIREKYGNRLALFYLNFPLPNHPSARPAAIAAMCAGAQGPYLPYHDLLFAHQQNLAHADYAAWAASSGLNRAKFEACVASGDMDRRVDDDIREGIAAGVNGTPTFFVNGRLVTKNDALLQVVAEEAATAR